MLDLVTTLTPSSLDLMGTRDEVLTAIAKDVEIHVRNDGFRRGVEMFFESLVKRLALATKLVNIEGNTEARADLSIIEAERKALIEELS